MLLFVMDVLGNLVASVRRARAPQTMRRAGGRSAKVVAVGLPIAAGIVAFALFAATSAGS